MSSPGAVADPAADPHYLTHGHVVPAAVVAPLAVAPVAVAPVATVSHVAPAPSCFDSFEPLATQTCTPRPDLVCTKTEVLTEEIAYEKLCKTVLSVLCDAPPVHAHLLVKRESKAEPQAALLASSLVPAPATTTGHQVVATVQHNCRQVSKQHCVDSPRVKKVPVEVEHCHTITKVTCSPASIQLPKTICTPVETKHGYHHA